MSNTEWSAQQDRILDLLKTRGYGQWVQRYEFLDLQPRICDFTTRIFELRHKRDLNIECQTKTVNGQKHSRYRMLPGSWRELRGKPESGYSPRPLPAKTSPPKTWEQVCAERDRKIAESQEPPVLVLTP